MEKFEIIKLEKSDADVSVSSDAVYSYPVHMHSYCEMTLYDAFEGNISVNDKTFDIKTKTAVLVVPSDFHRIEVVGETAARFVKTSFDISILQHGMRPDFSILMNNIQKDDFLIRLFDEICKNHDKRIYKQTLVNAAVCRMMTDGEPVLKSTISRGYRIAADAVKLINENFSGIISLSDAAIALSVTPQYLSAVFKKNIGIGFSEYLSSVRLRRAAKLIEETNESVTQICFECGYNNLSHFLRSFKAYFLKSPSEYRKGILNGR